MTDQSKDRAAVPIPPPLIFFGILGTAFILHFLFPLRLFQGFWILRVAVGIGLGLISGLLALFALFSMHKRKTPFDPSKPTLKIVTKGVFRFTRNPLYLSLVLLQGGIGVIFFSPWILLGVPVLFILLDFFAIRPEETYLDKKFGQEYLDYKASVRRWI